MNRTRDTKFNSHKYCKHADEENSKILTFPLKRISFIRRRHSSAR